MQIILINSFAAFCIAAIAWGAFGFVIWPRLRRK